MTKRTCAIEGCDRTGHLRRGWCPKHYQRWRLTGSTDGAGPSRPERLCAVDGCDEAHHAQSWCRVHYRAWERHGDPLGARLRIDGTPDERFWGRIAKSDGCWLWEGGTNADGYGLFSRRPGTTMMAHRYAYLTTVGPIPEGLELDHLCRVRLCVRSEHLEPVTHAENMRRAAPYRN